MIVLCVQICLGRRDNNTDQITVMMSLPNGLAVSLLHDVTQRNIFGILLIQTKFGL